MYHACMQEQCPTIPNIFLEKWLCVDGQDNVAVAGMEAFMANKQRARQLAAEQAQREEKAFILHPRDTHAPTVPQPFCLRTDLREVRRFDCQLVDMVKWPPRTQKCEHR